MVTVQYERQLFYTLSFMPSSFVLLFCWLFAHVRKGFSCQELLGDTTLILRKIVDWSHWLSPPILLFMVLITSPIIYLSFLFAFSSRTIVPRILLFGSVISGFLLSLQYHVLFLLSIYFLYFFIFSNFFISFS